MNKQKEERGKRGYAYPQISQMAQIKFSSKPEIIAEVQQAVKKHFLASLRAKRGNLVFCFVAKFTAHLMRGSCNDRRRGLFQQSVNM